MEDTWIAWSAFVKMEYNIHNYVFISVNMIEINSSNAFFAPLALAFYIHKGSRSFSTETACKTAMFPSSSE